MLCLTLFNEMLCSSEIHSFCHWIQNLRNRFVEASVSCSCRFLFFYRDWFGVLMDLQNHYLESSHGLVNFQ